MRASYYICPRFKLALLMKYLILVIATCLTLPALSQQKLAIELSSLNFLSYRHIDASDPALPPDFTENWNQEKWALRTGAGLYFNIGLTNTLRLKSGLRWMTKGYNSPKLTLKWGLDAKEGVWDPNDNPTTGSVQMKYYFSFAEIPVGIQYRLGSKGKWQLNTLFLAIPSIYIRSNNVQHFNSDKQSNRFRDKYIRDLHFAVQAAVGIDYSFTDKVQLFAQPSFYYNVTDMLDAVIKQYLYGAGLEAGVRLMIK